MTRNQKNGHDTSPSPWRTSTSDKPDRRHRVKCDVIESLLLDYINRELDPVRSDMVWKHIKKCADCEREVREMESTMAVLRNASRDRAGVPDRLSDKHRASIIRALTHPILHWMERYHVVSSLVVAVIVITAIVLCLRWVETHPEKPAKYEDPVDVNLGIPRVPTTNAPATNAVATNEDREVASPLPSTGNP